MQITVTGVVNTLIDLFALYIASLLLKCSDVAKWAIWTYIILHVIDLIQSIYFMFEPLKQTPTARADVSAVGVGIFVAIILILTLAVFAIDVYVLYKMYKCENVDKKLFWFFLASVLIGGIVKILFPNK